jgi:hypothetical protein
MFQVPSLRVVRGSNPLLVLTGMPFSCSDDRSHFQNSMTDERRGSRGRKVKQRWDLHLQGPNGVSASRSLPGFGKAMSHVKGRRSHRPRDVEQSAVAMCL